jgi:hypothetical protein
VAVSLFLCGSVCTAVCVCMRLCVSVCLFVNVGVTLVEEATDPLAPHSRLGSHCHWQYMGVC